MQRRASAMAVAAALVATLIGVVASPALAATETVHGLTADGRLIRFSSASPGTVASTATVTGLQAGERLLGIDVRPANAQLYGLGSTGRVYVVNTTSGAATQVGSGTFSPSLSGASFGFDFNPVPDRIRIVSDTEQNFRAHPDTSAFVDGDAATAGTQPDGALTYATGDAGAGTNPTIVGAAYTNNAAGATSTTNYAIDAARDVLVTQGSVGGTPTSPNSGQLLTVGALGVDTGADVGFDIAADGLAYASLTAPGATSSVFHTVDLSTGKATAVGTIGGGQVVVDIAVALPAPAPSTTIIGLAAPATLVRFGATRPGTVTNTNVTGLQTGESLLGIDVRPANARLYGLGSTGRLYTIDITTGAATQVGTSTTALTGTNFGFDFNPVPDRIRVVSDADQNFRLHPDTGALVDGDAATAGTQTDGTLAYASGDAGAGADPSITGAAYTNNTSGAASTTNYAVDSVRGTLVTQGSVNGAPTSPNAGQLFTVGSLGVSTGLAVGLDITADGTAYASFTAGATSSLYTVNLGTGAATLVGAVGGTQTLIDIAALLPEPVRRLAGADRIATAVSASGNAFPVAGGTGAAVLARSDDFADALAGTPLAMAKGGPLLLTESGTLSPAAKTELQRVLSPGGTVHLLGGTTAVSAAVAAEVTGLGFTVVRYAGADRYATAVDIASRGLGDPSTLLLATGRSFADALAGGAAAAKVGGAILLTEDGALPAPTAAYLNSRPTTTRFALGKAAPAAPTATAIVGADRYETARLVAETFFGAAYTTVGFASGESMADGLTGGAHIARLGGPLLLVRTNDVPSGVTSYLAARRGTLTGGFLYGGTVAVTEAVRLALQQSL